MSNIDKQALRIPERKKHNWSQAVMRDCDFCQQWALTVRHSDGGSTCASCCDSEYTTALYSALVVALDELEAAEKRNKRALALLNDTNTENIWEIIGRLKVVISGDYRSEDEIAAAGKGEES
ncbi:hypothetical protein ACE3JD_02280 [Enterobacter hormaechei subsp. steigerwaltii]|nr:hypothetical protein [Escherichia coli]